MGSPYRYEKELLRRVRESGWNLEDLSGIARCPLRTMYEILAGLTDPPDGIKERMALAIGCEVDELFPEREGR
jgi:hypothetical protein